MAKVATGRAPRGAIAAIVVGVVIYAAQLCMGGAVGLALVGSVVSTAAPTGPSAVTSSPTADASSQDPAVSQGPAVARTPVSSHPATASPSRTTGMTVPPTTAIPPATTHDAGGSGATPPPNPGGATDGQAPARCEGDYYVNSNGQCVHRPVTAPGPPTGATAQCRDGTYSFSQHRQGTCSSHGGVARWL